MNKIDAHQHFWRLSRGDYGWLRADDTALAPIYRDFNPSDLAPLLRSHSVSQTVLVQAAASEAETNFMLSLAAENPFIGGVVGWTDMSDAKSIKTLERWAKNPLFKGIRPMLQDLPDDNWIIDAPHPDVVTAIKRLGLRFDALVKPRHLDALLVFLNRHPDLPVVIDHAAKPNLAQGLPNETFAHWMRGLANLAQLPHVKVKLSGILTELNPDQLDNAEGYFTPVADFLAEIFGPSRILWGSDWPVLALAASYDRWVELASSFINRFDAGAQRAIWHDNALAFYGLKERAP